MNERQEKRLCCIAFEQTQAPTPIRYALVYFRLENILPGSDSELIKQTFVCCVPTRCTDIDENQTPSVHHGVWGGH